MGERQKSTSFFANSMMDLGLVAYLQHSWHLVKLLQSLDLCTCWTLALVSICSFVASQLVHAFPPLQPIALDLAGRWLHFHSVQIFLAREFFASQYRYKGECLCSIFNRELAPLSCLIFHLHRWCKNLRHSTWALKQCSDKLPLSNK